MKITQNVNIGGVAFTIDEDAYQSLSSYLMQIEIRLSPTDRREVMEDVENRVASIFSEQIGLRNQVVTSLMVHRAILIIGNADDFGQAPPSSYQNTTNQRNHTAKSDSGHGRFYRSGQDRIFGGICGGLAPVLDMDVSLIRLLMVLLSIFTFSTTFWIYIIVWIIIPLEPIKKQE